MAVKRFHLALISLILIGTCTSLERQVLEDKGRRITIASRAEFWEALTKLERLAEAEKTADIQKTSASEFAVSESNDCITRFKIFAKTGDLRRAGYSGYLGTPHHIVLQLKNGQKLQGKIRGPAYSNRKYKQRMKFARAFHTGNQCIKRSDIIQVSLVAGGYDGWYITKIVTYIKSQAGPYQELTINFNVNKWLDRRHSDTLELVLSLGIEDTPHCGYETPVCECKPEADICILKLVIEDIKTFISYEKHPVSEDDGTFVRGRRGVVFSIGSDGEQRPLEQYLVAPCAKKFDPTKCTNPLFVDGKTFRTAISVNGLIPGPTIIVHDQQKVVIQVHNNLSTEGISVHWHGQHQSGTPSMDGVGQLTQCHIGPSSSFSYVYTATPSGTFWYHSHSGAQRTDGLFGALIVKERPTKLNAVKKRLKQYGVANFEDHPGKHSITLLDWQQESSLDIYSELMARIGFFPGEPIGDVPHSNNYSLFVPTWSYDNGEVGSVPYFSGLINGKGRHNDVPYIKTRLSVFTVERGSSYRFRLIGVQQLYAYKFSIDGHKLTVVNTDGYWIEPQKQVDYIIIHSGERYDFILEAKATSGDYYWIRAETLEIDKESNGGKPPFKSLGHRAEAILQYTRKGVNAPDVHSSQYEGIKSASKSPECSTQRPCKAINCPFESFYPSYNTECVNLHQLRLLEATPSEQLPQAYPPRNCDNCLHFVNINFEGDSDTGSVNGRNHIFPPVPPQTQFEDFKKQAKVCNLTTDCNPSTLDCLCTHVIDVPYKRTVQLVITAIGRYRNSHPMHFHGHSFHVVHIGYPVINQTNGFIHTHSPDIQCGDRASCQGKPQDSGCDPMRCTQPSWRNNRPPHLTIDPKTIRKDTFILPAYGYVVINFISDNPGWWFLHCHIDLHQVKGMAIIVNEALDQQNNLDIPSSINKCGDVGISMEEYEALSQQYLPQFSILNKT